jgi:hypothetical protein
MPADSRSSGGRRRGGGAGAGASAGAARASLAETWRRLNPEQRVAGVAALLLAISTLGPFSFVELAVLAVAGGVLWLLKKRADGAIFHLPFGDGGVIVAAGAWSALLIVVRLFDRPLGQGLLALVCSAILVLAGLRERAKRPADDVPAARPPDRPGATVETERLVAPRRSDASRRGGWGRQAREADPDRGRDELRERARRERAGRPDGLDERPGRGGAERERPHLEPGGGGEDLSVEPPRYEPLPDREGRREPGPVGEACERDEREHRGERARERPEQDEPAEDGDRDEDDPVGR